MAYLLDTNVVSELRKQAPDENVAAWHRRNAAADAYVSVLTLGEIRQGIERIRRRDAPHAGVLDRWLERLATVYRDRVLTVSADIADEWGRLQAFDPPPAIDGLIAATAKVHHLVLVTRNVRDVARTGVQLVNPFEPT
ncbi:type II toxin-antitoxin system VapC family toxin [Dactylosporangium sp. CA-092794]|uniref:type II toxin-antitoxin system VapC family toxin n=1 Tax=Dactylosporangium sp. CA-092794 TaxID=3239929 RepID=UPI003D9171F6